VHVIDALPAQLPKLFSICVPGRDFNRVWLLLGDQFANRFRFGSNTFFLTIEIDKQMRASLRFFFYSHGHPRDLHSFPTRRSSDLRAPARGACARSNRYHKPSPELARGSAANHSLSAPVAYRRCQSMVFVTHLTVE